MLPESRTLKAAGADKHGVSTKRSAARINPKLRYNMVEGSAPQGAVTRPVRALFLEMDMAVFVLDRKGKALMPCSEKRARLLLECGRVRVHRVLPFVIRLTDRSADTCA